MNTRFLLPLALLCVGTLASANPVTPAVKAEANKLALQYTGKGCKVGGQYDLTVEPFKRRLNAAEVKVARDYTYRALLQGFDKMARRDHYTYEVRYNGNRVWLQAKKPDTNERAFSIGTVTPTGIRLVSCEQ